MFLRWNARSKRLKEIVGQYTIHYSMITFLNSCSKVWLNMLYIFEIRFQQKNSISPVHGPTTLLTGLPMPSSSYFALEFGTYCLVHDHPENTNAILPAWTTPAIAMLPANRNKGWYFLSLLSGEKIIRYEWDVLPITQKVISRVNDMAKSKKSTQAQNMLFEWAPGVPITNDIATATNQSNNIIMKF